MQIHREWHYIDRQAIHEAMDQMLPSAIPSSLVGPTIVHALKTMGKARLHTKCHFNGALVIKA